MKFRIGDYVKVKECNGLDSGRTGIIVSPKAVKTDGRCIPTNVVGAYKPVDWNKEVAIKDTMTGDIFTMFKSHIIKL